MKFFGSSRRGKLLMKTYASAWRRPDLFYVNFKLKGKSDFEHCFYVWTLVASGFVLADFITLF